MRVVNLNASALDANQLMALAMAAVNPIYKDVVTPERYLRRVAEEGKVVAEQVYATHPSDSVNPAPITVSADAKGNTGTLTASGAEIGFVEFGTGVNNREWAGSGGMDFTPPPHGSYGKGQGANPNGWYYDGEITKGQEPAEAMLEAWFKIVSSYKQVGREVFEE